ncbi:MAG: DUF349 domain-containing protein [Proteobacteria bacterium]|nr:DUF349 domain-containing protein [Pseudomonadota bacterium]MBU1716570.1 DUF349 domain-containing protein [Pseudomonadota bacterium]
MALLDFVKPKLQHSNPEVRLSAVRAMESPSPEVLISLIKDDKDLSVRLAAIELINDQTTLETLAGQELEPAATQAITARINILLFEDIILTADSGTKETSLTKLTDIGLLARVAVEAKSPEIRMLAVSRIDDQKILSTIVEQNCGKGPALAAVGKIHEEELLKGIKEKGASKAARKLALEKLAAIEAERNKPSKEELINSRLQEIIDQGTKLLTSANLDLAAEPFAELRRAWQEIDQEETHPLHPKFEQLLNEFQERYQTLQEKILEERRKAELIISRLAEYENICSAIEALIGTIEKESSEKFKNFFSAWQQAVNDKEYGTSPSEALKTRFEKACQSFEKTQKQIDLECETLTAFEQEFETITSTDQQSPTRKLQWLTELEKNIAQHSFRYLTSGSWHERLVALRQKLTELLQELEKASHEARQENMAKRQALIEQIEELITAENRTKADNQIKILHAQWESLPPLFGADKEEITNRYRAALENFSGKQQEFYHEQDWQQWSNQTLKEKLLKASEELDSEENLERIVGEIKKLQAAWKEIGPVPRKVSQKLWDKFHAACTRNYERCQPYFDELKQKKQETLKRKEELCVLAEELSESTDWQATADKLKALQAQWKEIKPPLQPRQEDKIYARFRQACNHFFERRHTNFAETEKERLNNLQEKEKLCIEAALLCDEPQWENNEKFRQLQTRWKKIGHVPREQEKEVWKKFRASCDKFFNWMDEQRQENLQRKEALCLEVESILAATNEESDDNTMRLTAVKLAELQQQWKEIGPVPQDQNEQIWQRFHQPCDEFFKIRNLRLDQLGEVHLKNKTKKEEILLRAEEIASAGSDKDIAKQLQTLQKEWKEVGPAAHQDDKELNQNFKTICDCFFEGRRQHFEELQAEQIENLKKKETLCLQLENITGQPAGKSTAFQNQALSLAEQLKLSMEANFIMAGNRNDQQAKKTEVQLIQQAWEKIGSVPRINDKPLWQRYRKALDSFYKDDRPEKEPKK